MRNGTVVRGTGCASPSSRGGSRFARNAGGVRDHQDLLVLGGGPVEDLERVPVRAELTRLVADDEQQRLGQQLVREVVGARSPPS
ncbi:hypothetical protein [Streptomyces sp. NPDC050564]|uniref:hypothetical protein n=1 Tax=Streptomyces sp. NPDC050564 TaxID=3365631 RepID=UPI003797FA3E